MPTTTTRKFFVKFCSFSLFRQKSSKKLSKARDTLAPAGDKEIKANVTFFSSPSQLLLNIQSQVELKKRVSIPFHVLRVLEKKVKRKKTVQRCAIRVALYRCPKFEE